MPGSATLGTNLVDSLIPDVVDELRDSLHPDLGVRQFRAFVVTRTWSGASVGEGTSSEVAVEVLPQPLVEPYVESLRFRLEPCGLDEAGVAKVREVSLTYTETELAGPVADDMRQELFWRITDAHGQGIPAREFYVDSVPFPDRISDMGWQVRLRAAGG